MSQIYFSEYLRNTSGSNNLNVNGSVTPVTYSLDIAGLEGVACLKVNGYLEIGGNIKSYADFMSIPALTNGLVFEVQSQGVTYTSAAIRNNRDIVRFFNRDFAYKKRNTDSSFGNNNAFIGTRQIQPSSIVLSNRTNDFFRITVRDDLSALTYFSIEVEGSSI